MTRLRLTKYDPGKRDATGKYLRNDWTSVSDVGRYFEGERLTIAEYLRTEGSYVDTVEKLVSIAGIEKLIIRELEINEVNEDLPKSLKWDAETRPEMLTKKLIIHGQTIADVVRLALREMIWCKLSGSHGFYVHFGRDYYMYAGFNGDLPEDAVFSPRIYVESCRSPYA